VTAIRGTTTRRIEEMDQPRLYVFRSGGEMAPRSILDPFDDDRGAFFLAPFHFYAITHPKGNVLFDSGIHRSFATDARAHAGDFVDEVEVRLDESEIPARRLEEIGLKTTDIDLVIQSHLHYDHAGGLDQFPGADVLVHTDELEFARKPPVYQAGSYLANDFAAVGSWQTVADGHDVFGDGVLELVHTPGHTPGHMSLMVRLSERPVLLGADVAYDLTKMKERKLPGLLWSPDLMVASWERVEDLCEKERAELIISHDLGFETQGRLAPSAWYE
jgi:N-acyl homoserine lactone hydrolase